MKYFFRFCAALALLLPAPIFFRLQSAGAQTPLTAQLNILAMDAHGLTIELTTPGVTLTPVTIAGEVFQQVTMAGANQTTIAGSPQLPVVGTLLGVPAGDDLSVEILVHETEAINGVRILPAPAIELDSDDPFSANVVEIHTPDPVIYTKDAFFPAVQATVKSAGLLRDQPVASLQIYPAQVNPVSGDLHVTRRLVVRIGWTDDIAAAGDLRPDSLNFENLLRDTLLNYQQVPQPRPLAPPPAHEIDVADAAPALKIGVDKNGVYRLTHADLTGAGFNLAGLDPRNLRLQNRGTDIPIIMEGEADGVFDPADTVLFYGRALTSVYTSENIYWLTSDGPPGPRMASRSGAPGGSAPIAAEFPKSLHAELDSFYWQTMPDGAGQDHWFWGDRLNAPQTRTYYLGLSHISTTASTATLRVALKGYTNTQHHTRLWLNGTPVATQTWAGQSMLEQTAVVPHSSLIDGYNAVTIEALTTTTAAVDQLLVNWIEIDYHDSYTASSNNLLFSPPAAGTYQFTVTNFNTPDISVFDISNLDTPIRITNTSITAAGTGYQVQFDDSVPAQTSYQALTPDRFKTPSSLTLDQPSAWRSTAIGADYIIITHRDFLTATAHLAAHRQAQGLRVVTVDVQDIYDEFSHGIFGPQAIRDFLSYAYFNWQSPAPSFALLVGDAYQDYKDNLNTGTANYVPTQLVLTDLLGETPSDNWFVQVNGADVLPDMFIGRLSVQSAAQAQTVINKIIQYDAVPSEADWQRQIAMIADDDSMAFTGISEQLIGVLPAGYTSQRIYADDFPPGDPTSDILSALNSGVLLANYSGHGSVERWGLWSGGDIFHQSDVAGLANTGKPAVVTIANCLNGFFTGASDTEAFAETIHRLDNGGAVGVWAATGLDYPSGHRQLMSEFYTTIFQNQQQSLGAATTTAKINTFAQNNAYSELVQSFILFGDPATALNISPQNNQPDWSVNLPIIIK
jgi:hypothetical protein